MINVQVHTYKYEHVLKDKHINVFRLEVKGNDMIFIKSYSVLDYDKEVLLKAISDARVRKKWDKVFSEFSQVEAD